jgi:hypothetical protein
MTGSLIFLIREKRSTTSRFDRMHAGVSYLNTISKAANHAVLSASEAQSLQLALHKDAKDFFQSGAVSFIDALRSIEKGFFSWATVKLYYSVFYALQSRLALAGDCIFYVVKSPRVLSARAGSVTANLKGTTHKAVLARFRHNYPGDYFLSQDIGGWPPLDWFIARREETNYTSARFCEPNAPSHFEFAKNTNMRKMLSAYTADDLYVFDEQHAMVAFPFKLLRDLRVRLAAKHLSPLVPAETDFLKSSVRDRSGPLRSVDILLS